MYLAEFLTHHYINASLDYAVHFRFLFSKSKSGYLIDAPSFSKNVFYAVRNGTVSKVVSNGTKLDYYKLASDFTWTSLGSVDKPALYSDPSSFAEIVDTDAYSPGTSQPVFFYLGTDSHYHSFLPYAASSPVSIRVDTGEYSDNSVWDYIKNYFGWDSSTASISSLAGSRPFASFEPAVNNFFVLSQKQNA